MPHNASAPWHKASFDRFLSERLPELLAARLPLAGYRVEHTGPHACRVTVVITGGSGDVEVEYSDVPQPDTGGVFVLDGKERVVVPTASSEDLDVAEVRCVGEQLLGYVEERLGEAPSALPWDAALARTWLPLDAWIAEFLTTAPTAQAIDDLNWLSRHTHLRRIVVPDRQRLVTQSQFGRVCPFETPEGPNIAKVFSLALGAEIRDGRLVVTDDRPEAALGLTASMVPFLEHNDANRVLMGVNMLRQQLVPPDPEPALVQTGNEPDAPGFWCGRNLLTAFVSWGIETFEDAILISESCARKLDFPIPVEPGDKLANRHGTKGTVSRIVPDAAMPHLPDGMPVELCFSFIGCHTRLNFGQMREAVMSRIARAEGTPAVVPPFQAPREDELRERLTKAGLPESGMETLSMGKDGPPLARPSTVGWVYWGKLDHLAGKKIHSWTSRHGQRQGELEYYALRDVGAFETIAETFNTRSAERPDADTLAARVAAGPVEQAGPPTPALAEVQRRLAVAWVRVELTRDGLALDLVRPGAEALRLAHPVRHPWLRELGLTALGRYDSAEFAAVAEANARLERMLTSRAPESLIEKAIEQLEACVHDLFATLLPPECLRLGARSQFSGRAVLSPALGLTVEQVGLADELAWDLFGPLVTRELGAEAAVRARTEAAAQALDAIMARSWVLVNRAPTIMPTSILAFRPVRQPHHVIRLHPLACPLMNADFDGDQAAVFLPVTEAGQREARDKLSVAAHLERDPELLGWLLPSMAARWGLASLSRTPKGRAEIAELAGAEVAAPEGFITKASLLEAMRRVLERDGVQAALEALERLMRRGFEAAKASGASMSPFVGAGLDRPPAPDTDEPAAWTAHHEELLDRVEASTDFDSPERGPQLLAVKSGTRGSVRQLACLLGSRGAVIDADGRPVVPVRRGLSQGLSPREAFACVIGARKGLGRTVEECARMGYGIREASLTKGFSVLARAVRAAHPGVVFARAAATGEVDPLTDLDSRLFVGLGPE